MSKRKEKSTTWKDTNKYPFSIQYNYPLSIKNRCLFFWATTLKGWKAVINLAHRLTEANRVCVLYLFGNAKEEIVLRHIKKLNNQNLIVLWANHIEKGQIESVMKGAETIILIAERWPIGKRIELDERNPYEGNAIEDEIYKTNLNLGKADCIKNGRKELKNIQETITKTGYKNLSDSGKTVSSNEESHIDELLKIICRIYPYGIEGDTRQEYSYKLLHAKKWCDSGVGGKMNDLEKLGVSYKDYSKPTQLSLFDETSWGIIEFVKEFRNVCDAEIQKNGFVDLRTVFLHMQESPFGMYKCNYYGLCIGIALQKYKRKYYKSGNLTTVKTEDINFADCVEYIFNSFNMNNPTPLYIYVQSEKQIKFSEKLLKIFKPDYNVKVLCLENVLTAVRSWFSENIAYDTVQRTVPELFEIINLWEPCVLSNATEKYADWLTDEKVEKIKESILNIDSNFLKMLSDNYGKNKADLYAKSQMIRGGAVGWLHSVEMVDERVENYMKKETICRECGAIIHNQYEVYENGNYRNRARITKQNVINLNKKFLGRYQNEYFCISCLCEVLETTEWGLYESMIKFKEQGCELF